MYLPFLALCLHLVPSIAIEIILCSSGADNGKCHHICKDQVFHTERCSQESNTPHPQFNSYLCKTMSMVSSQSTAQSFTKAPPPQLPTTSLQPFSPRHHYHSYLEVWPTVGVWKASVVHASPTNVV